MHPEDIKAELRKAFVTVKAFEAAKALPKGSVRDLLRGRTSRPTADAIADALQRPVKKLFPGRFDQVRKDHKSHKRDSHRLNAAGR